MAAWPGRLTVALAIAVAGCAGVEQAPNGTRPSGSGSSETTIERSDSSSSNDHIEPITGYGDFSEYGPNEIDDVMVMERIVECVADQGLPMYFDPIEGMEIEGELPPEQSERMGYVLEACTAGLNLPTQELTRDEIVERYEFTLFSTECLRDEGWNVGEPPSQEEWVDTWPDSWSPVDALPPLAIGNGLELDGCPLRFRVDWESWGSPDD